MKKEPLIIGHIGHASIGMEMIPHIERMQHTADVIIIGDFNPDDSFELNGARYAPIEKERVIKDGGRQRKSSSILLSLGFFSIFSHLTNHNQPKTRNRSLPKGTDIKKEYGLIQNKKSNLSKWERDQVVHIFELNYYKL